MIVVDASVAAKWILTEEYTTQARLLLQSTLAERETIAAPPLLPYEITNIMRKRIGRGDVSLQTAQADLVDFLAIPVDLLLPAHLHERALEIAGQFNLSAAYDAHYIALAEHLDCDLCTDDQRLLNTLGSRLSYVRPIASYS